MNPQENPPRNELKAPDEKPLTRDELEQQFTEVLTFTTEKSEAEKKAIEEKTKEAKEPAPPAAEEESEQASFKKPTTTQNNVENSIRKWGLTALAALGLASSAGAHPKNEKNDTDPKLKKESARKVADKPEGYTFIGNEDGKNYYLKTWENELSFAKSGGEKGGKEYEEKIIDIIKKGKATPDELAKKGYIHPDRVQEFNQYVDLVYTETAKKIEEQKEDPFAAFGGRREPIYDGNKHIAAEIWYSTTESKDVRDAGIVHTPKAAALIMFRDDFKQKGYITVTAEQLRALVGETNTIKSADLYKQMLASAQQEKETGEHSEDLAQTDK